MSRKLICVLDKRVNNNIGYHNWLNRRVSKITSRVVGCKFVLIWCKVRIEMVMFLCVFLFCDWNDVSQLALITRCFIDLLAWIVYFPTLIDISKFPRLACLLNVTNFVLNAFSCILVLLNRNIDVQFELLMALLEKLRLSWLWSQAKNHQLFNIFVPNSDLNEKTEPCISGKIELQLQGIPELVARFGISSMSASQNDLLQQKSSCEKTVLSDPRKSVIVKKLVPQNW